MEEFSKFDLYLSDTEEASLLSSCIDNKQGAKQITSWLVRSTEGSAVNTCSIGFVEQLDFQEELLEGW